jgi:futalosine hydrolase
MFDTEKKNLIVAATFLEAEKIINALPFEKKSKYLYVSPTLDVLITGIGMVNTAFIMGKEIRASSYKLIINIGIAGGFDYQRPLGALVEVQEETFIEMGAETDDFFLSLEHLNFPFYFNERENKIHYNTFYNPFPFTQLEKVKGITCNTIHSNEKQIERIKALWPCDIETMESGAFFRCALEFNIPFVAIRAISNYIEKRDKSKWQIHKALENLWEFTFEEFIYPS